jgi:hypothetical protein
MNLAGNAMNFPVTFSTAVALTGTGSRNGAVRASLGCSNGEADIEGLQMHYQGAQYHGLNGWIGERFRGHSNGSNDQHGVTAAEDKSEPGHRPYPTNPTRGP